MLLAEHEQRTWASITRPDTVLLLAALSMYLGGIVGFSKALPRALRHDEGWRRSVERHPVSSALTIAVLSRCGQ